MMLYDPREDPRRTQHRIFFWLAIAFNIATFLAAAISTYFSYQQSWSPVPIAIIAFFLVINVGFFGDWTMNREQKGYTYLFLVFQYVLSGLMFILCAVAFVEIAQVEEYLEENWDIVQLEVIPFTSLLAEKRLFASVQSATAYLGWVATLANMDQATRAFGILDTHARLAHQPWRLLGPQLALIGIIAATTVGNGLNAAYVSTFAHPSNESALLFTIVTAFFSFLMIIIMVATIIYLGGHHTTYTIAWTTTSILALFALIGGATTAGQASEVEAFTRANWEEIRLFLPPAYPHRRPDKYILEASTLLRLTGLGGVMIFLFSLIFIATTMHSAFLLVAISPGARAGYSNMADSDTPLSTPGADEASATPLKASARDGGGSYYGALAGEARAGSSAAAGSAAGASAGKSSLRADGGVGSSVGAAYDSDEEASSSAARPATGDSSAAYRATASARGGTTLHGDEDPPLPSWGEYAQVSRNSLRVELVSRWICVVFMAILSVVLISGLSAGMVTVQNAARCGELARGAGFKRSYFVNHTIHDQFVYNLANVFPRGRLMIQVQDYNTMNSSFYVDITMWTLEESHMMSVDELTADLKYNPGDGNPYTASYTGTFAPKVPTQQAADGCDVLDVIVTLPVFYYGTNPTIQDLRARGLLTEEASASGQTAWSTSLADFRDAMRPEERLSRVLRSSPEGKGVLKAGRQSFFVPGEVVMSDEALSSMPVSTHQPHGRKLQSFSYASAVSINLRTESAVINVTSSLLGLLPPAISTLWTTTTDGPTVIHTVLAYRLEFFNDPNVGPSVKTRSQTGEVDLSTVVAYGFDVETSGDVTALAVSSGYIDFNTIKFYLGGIMRLATTMTGQLVLTQGFGARDASLETEAGDILIVNCAGVLGDVMTIESTQGGDVWLSNYLLGSGNRTIVRTSGNTHGSVIYVNTLEVDHTQGGSASILEVFVGVADVADPEAFSPPLEGVNNNASVRITAPAGSISLTGIGGAPSTNPNVSYASTLAVDLSTTDGNIDVQINGGGYIGEYNARTTHGIVTVEIEGRTDSASGGIGSAPTKSPGHFNLNSVYGDLNLVILPNSIPDLGELGLLL